MSNAKQRAIDALGATFNAIEGLSREEAFQSATYVVEELIVAMGPCQVDKCQNHGICEDHIPPEPCLESCGDTDCTDNQEARCYAENTCSGRYRPAPEELLQGYTLEQWEEIRAGGYLCQFSNVTNDGRPDWKKPVARLTSLGGRWEDSIPEVAFLSESGNGYAFCRPAQIPGVLRPWFGGDCPVDPDTRVFAIFRRPGAYIQKAGSLNWSHNRELHSNAEITAFMVIPE